MVTNNPLAQYKEQALNTLAPGEVLVKLFDELLKQGRLAVIAIDKRDFAQANDSLTKGQTILSTLASSLDMRYPIARELKDMYIFLAQQLLRANLQKDTQLVEDCLPILRDLRDSFEQAERTHRAQTAVGGRAV